ncbi:MAG: DUF2760 domain-containing protein [Verrucomicrobiales bacterium]|nr:DUF2760 domain-containing protein [Verrucomicrobiales bacterium]
MKKSLPFLAIALVIAVGVLFAELTAQVETAVKAVAALLGVVLTIGLFQTANQPAGSVDNKPKEEAGKPAPGAGLKGDADAEVITFLARMQEKGRLIDFLMDDISAHDDAAIGAAARVVHQGCKAVLDEHLTVEAIDSGGEGSKVTIPEGYDAGSYRLTGNLSGNAPFKGTLVHKGWKVSSVRLPKVIVAESGDLPALAPAQVEV